MLNHSENGQTGGGAGGVGGSAAVLGLSFCLSILYIPCMIACMSL